MCPQFLQLRKSVVLTSNFAKSVVNLADMVRGSPWKEFVPGRLIPASDGFVLWGLHSPSFPRDLSPVVLFLERGFVPCPGGFVPGGVILEGTVPSSWWICTQGVCPYFLVVHPWGLALSTSWVGPLRVWPQGVCPTHVFSPLALGGFVPLELCPWGIVPGDGCVVPVPEVVLRGLSPVAAGFVPGRGRVPSPVPLSPQIYKEQLNTRIVLVAMETWAAEDRIRMGQDSLEILNEFVKYRREGLAEHSDTVHLFS